MQDRYTGDVGDFAKLGLLRQLSGSGLKLGINWYLAPDERHNGDGKHVGYVTAPKYDGCDDALRIFLKSVVCGRRAVSALESLELIPNAIYCHEALHPPSRAFSRRDWHMKALTALRSADVVFLDPDNGLLVKSVSIHSSKSNKYVLSNEIVDYFAAGQSVIIYNHRGREKEAVYLRRFDWMREDATLQNAVIEGFKFSGGTVRDFLFVMQPSHAATIMACVEKMLRGAWGNHFSKLDFAR